MTPTTKNKKVPSPKNPIVLSESQRVLATIKKILSTSIYSTSTAKSQNALSTKSQKLLSDTQKAHTKVRKSAASTRIQKFKKYLLLRSRNRKKHFSLLLLPTANKRLLLTESATLPSAAASTAFRSVTCASKHARPQISLSRLAGDVTIPKHRLKGSPYDNILKFKECSSHTESAIAIIAKIEDLMTKPAFLL